MPPNFDFKLGIKEYLIVVLFLAIGMFWDQFSSLDIGITIAVIPTFIYGQWVGYKHLRERAQKAMEQEKERRRVFGA